MEKLAALKSGADMRLQALFFAASAIGARLIGFVTVFALFKQADAGVLAAANSSARIKLQ